MAHPAPMALRRCTACLKSKPYREFHTKVDGAHSMTARCKSCVRTNKPERVPVKEPDGPPPQLLRRARMLQKEYGLTLADYAAMFEDQGGHCGICRRPERDGKLLSVDHCHTTGRVRGLLCTGCNTSLGKLGDTAEALRAALAYLEK